MRAKHGFTLIEFLVVIGATAAMAGVLLPAVKRARQGREKSACISNLKKIGAAIRMYVQDWDGFYPPSHSYPNTWGQCPHLVWSDIVYPYVRNLDTFRCPSRRGLGWVYSNTSEETNLRARACQDIVALYGSPPTGTLARPHPYGYLYNEGYDDDRWARCEDPSGRECYWGMVWRDVFEPRAWTWAPLHSDPEGEVVFEQGANEAMFEQPSETIALVDGHSECSKSRLLASSGGANSVFRVPRDTDVHNPRRIEGCYIHNIKVGRTDKRHRGGLNVLFADGHANWQRQTRLKQWTRVPSRVPANMDI